jgi:hypothetical protein
LSAYASTSLATDASMQRSFAPIGSKSNFRPALVPACLLRARVVRLELPP